MATIQKELGVDELGPLSCCVSHIAEAGAFRLCEALLPERIALRGACYDFTRLATSEVFRFRTLEEECRQLLDPLFTSICRGPCSVEEGGLDLESELQEPGIVFISLVFVYICFQKKKHINRLIN